MSALERNEDVPGLDLRLEGGGPRLFKVRCVIANIQRATVQSVDSLPRFSFESSFFVLEIDPRRRRARIHAKGTSVRGLPPFDWIWKRLPVKTSRFPTTSSAALPSRSPFVAIQAPCSFSGLPRPARQKREAAKFRGPASRPPKKADGYF
jgi:hypothetical protein